MGTLPRDPLAEHPLGGEPEPSPRKGRAGRTLDLFPDVGQTVLEGRSPSETVAGGGTETQQRAEPSSSESGADPIEDAGEPLDPGPLLLDDSADGEGAVAFARRMAAGLADLLILALFGAVELTAGAFILELRFPPAALLSVLAFLFLAALVLLVLAPFVWGATPGMALADLRIRAADGGSPTLAASSLRFLGFVLTGTLAGVPLLVAAFDRRGRTLADLLSGTTIVPAERPKRLDPEH
jgi:uncharacterized RDD family membrane protein YckC